MNVAEITAKSLLVTSKLPDADYVANPYTGCEFGCLYCYASFMGRFVGEPFTNWGNYLYAKVNAVELIEKELRSWPAKKKRGTILLSSVTDPYQGAEKNYRLTRGILEALVRDRYPGLISVLTKSPLVLRDLDLLTELPRVEVGLTITTTDDALSRFLEVRAPLATRRLETLRQLKDAGLTTYAFIGPLLPHFRYEPERLNELFAAVAATRVDSVFVEHINLKRYIRDRLFQTLDGASEEVRAVYAGASDKEHRAALEPMVRDLIERYGLKLRLSEVLYHDAGQAKAARSEASVP
jgi:DNA repair photolyase